MLSIEVGGHVDGYVLLIVLLLLLLQLLMLVCGIDSASVVVATCICLIWFVAHSNLSTAEHMPPCQEIARSAAQKSVKEWQGASS